MAEVIEGTASARATSDEAIDNDDAAELDDGVIDKHIEFTLGPNGFTAPEQQDADAAEPEVEGKDD